MKKELVLLFVVSMLVIPMISASVSSDMAQIESYVDQYNAGALSAAKLIVYVEYIKNKMYETLDKENRPGFYESEILGVFEEKEQNEALEYMNKEKWGMVKEGGYVTGNLIGSVSSIKLNRFGGISSKQFEKKFITDDFHIVFTANSHYKLDREFYEDKEKEEPDIYYTIWYNVKTTKGRGRKDKLQDEIDEFISDLKSLINNYNDEEFEQLRKDFSKIRSSIREIDKDECGEIMQDAGMVEEEGDYNEGAYYYLMKEQVGENCWADQKCEWTCEDIEVCPEDCVSTCYNETVCESICKDVFNNETNQTEQDCTEVCGDEETCSGCECRTKQECENVCQDTEQCNEWVEGEIKIRGHCREDFSDISVSAYGTGFDKYQELNKGGEWDCSADMEGLITLRKAFQKGLNNDFAVWFFEDFMGGENYDKIINGGDGFKNVLRILTSNEEQIAGMLYCSEDQTWPDGFEKISIEYINNNTRVEVWEKKIPVEWDAAKYYTTLYKYSWIPDKELLIGLINYKLDEMGTIGPSAKDVARIRVDEGQMELVQILAEKYGGSFDVMLKLEEEGEEVLKKYLQINEEVVVKITDSIDENPDISINVDYDVLYNFITYISYTKEGDRIYGPHWVRITGERGGPGEFFGVLGAVSKMWREGITLKPRYALLKLFFNSGKIISLMTEAELSSSYQGEVVELSEEAIKEAE